MPLETGISRNGELLQLRWGYFHLAAMCIAEWLDDGKYTIETLFPLEEQKDDEVRAELVKLYAEYPERPIIVGRSLINTITYAGYYGPMSTCKWGNHGSYTLKGKHHFKDATDGEILTLLPGDILFGGRVSK